MQPPRLTYDRHGVAWPEPPPVPARPPSERTTGSRRRSRLHRAVLGLVLLAAAGAWPHLRKAWDAVPAEAPPAPPAAPAPDPHLLTPVAIEASTFSVPSTDGAGAAVTFGPDHAVDLDPATAWRVDGDGRGAWLLLDFGGPHHITRVGVVPGWPHVDPVSGTDRFQQNRRPALVGYLFDDGTALQQELTDEPRAQVVDVDVAAQRLLVVVLEPAGGQTPRDALAVAEVLVVGR